MPFAERVAAERARGPPAAQQALTVLDHARRLLPSEQDPCHCPRCGAAGPAAAANRGSLSEPCLPTFVGGGLTFPLPNHLARHEDHPVHISVVSQLHRTNHPLRFHRLFEFEVGAHRDRRWAGQVGEHLGQPARQEYDLFFLQLQRDQLVALAGLQIEHTLARRAYGPDCHTDRVGKVERSAQRYLLGDSPGSVFTVARPEGPVQFSSVTLGAAWP